MSHATSCPGWNWVVRRVPSLLPLSPSLLPSPSSARFNPCHVSVWSPLSLQAGPCPQPSQNASAERPASGHPRTEPRLRQPDLLVLSPSSLGLGDHPEIPAVLLFSCFPSLAPFLLPVAWWTPMPLLRGYRHSHPGTPCSGLGWLRVHLLPHHSSHMSVEWSGELVSSVSLSFPTYTQETGAVVLLRASLQGSWLGSGCGGAYRSGCPCLRLSPRGGPYLWAG